MLYSKDEIAAANSMSIADYFQSHGYSCEKQGREIRVHGFDAMTINPEKNTFYRWGYQGNSENKGGYGLVTCLQKVLDYSFTDAMKEAYGEPRGEQSVSLPRKTEFVKPVQAPTEPKVFELPEAADNNKRVFAYLTQSRKIPAAIVNDMIKQNLLYQEKDRGNAVFVHRNKLGEAVGAEIQGTCTDKRFKGITPGTKGTFIYEKGEPNRLILFESSIDMMSFIALHPEVNNAVFAAMAGLKPTIAEDLVTQLFTPDKIKIISCVDNDNAGCDFNHRFMLKTMALRSNIELDINKDLESGVFTGSGELNGQKYMFFCSNADANEYKKYNDTAPDCKLIVPRSTMDFYKVSYECLHNDVKDYNDLLKKSVGVDVPSAAKEDKPVEKQEKIYEYAR